MRYNAVVDACALRPDLDRLEDGDTTEIGARGVSLSGGQKARVALARAVYSRARYVLLDDPLSAVDSHTARFLYEKLFLGELMKGRTVVLVTHHMELVLPGAGYLVRMVDGRVDVQGSVKDLRERGVLETVKLEGSVEEQKEVEKEKKDEEEREAEEGISAGAADADAAGDGAEGGAISPAKKKPRKLVKDEEREEGAVKWRIYKTYLEATWVFPALFLLS